MGEKDAGFWKQVRVHWRTRTCAPGETVYAIVEKHLADLLSQQTYPQLHHSVFSYKENGVWKTIPYDSLLGANKQPVPVRCQQAAALVIRDLAQSGGVKEFGSRQAVKAQLWSKPLCRGLGPVGKTRVDGPWWFEAELVQRWEKVYAAEMPGKRRDKVLEAIRPMLAICHDWNDLLRLVTMTPGGGIPVLTGQGTHQPIVSKGLKHDPKRLMNYDPKETVVFIGGFQQVFVPFVPVQLVSNYF